MGLITIYEDLERIERSDNLKTMDQVTLYFESGLELSVFDPKFLLKSKRYLKKSVKKGK